MEVASRPVVIIRVAKYALGRLIIDEMVRQNLSRTDLASRMGYTNISKALRRLDHLLEYGFEPVILPRIIEALGLSEQIVAAALAATQEELQAERDEAARRQEEYRRANFRPYIVALTDRCFPEPVFAAVWGQEALTRIHPPRRIVESTLATQIAWASEVVPKHYHDHRGRLPAFGAITGYTYRRSYDDAITFDLDGRVMNHFADRPEEFGGSLFVKGKRLPRSVFRQYGLAATSAR